MFNSKFDTIFCPPVNSSGDVYHIAAYLVLCRTMHQEVPQIILFCDTDDTNKQAQRNKSFLNAMGFTNVRVERFAKTSAQPAARLSRSSTLVKSFSECAVDQKTTTSLISFAQLVYGKSIHDMFAQHVLNRGFRPKAIAAYTWATAQVETAIKILNINKQRFVILNLRYSENANEAQNMTEPQLKTISKTLAGYGCKLIIIDVGGGQGNSFIKKHNGDEYASAIVINAFPTLGNLDKNYEKFPHLFLLLQLAHLPNFLGVMGNTSGTLDVAAFMGIRTLCVHRFKSTSSKNIIVPYQDLRVLLQANIMSVFDYAAGLQSLAVMIRQWLMSEQHIVCHLLSRAEKITLETNGFTIEHYDRKCFALDVNKKIANRVFKAQHLQIIYDQKLSESRMMRINNQDPVTPLMFSSASVKHIKDDTQLKSAKPMRRSISMPTLNIC